MTATNVTVASIVANLATHGLAIESREIATDGGKMSLGVRPHVIATDLDLFVSWYGAEKVMSFVNGTSMKVKMQNVIRTSCVENSTIKDDELIEKQIASLLGVTVRRAPAAKIVEVKVYTDMRGTTHPTADDAYRANIAILVENGIPFETAKTIATLPAE